jgi:hypothetical protein
MIRAYITESFRLVGAGIVGLSILFVVWAISPKVDACGFKSVDCRSGE